MSVVGLLVVKPMSQMGQNRKSPPGDVMSALPPTADMQRLHRHVGFVPEAEVAASFDYLVGEHKQLRWKFDTERLSGLEIYDKIKFG